MKKKKHRNNNSIAIAVAGIFIALVAAYLISKAIIRYGQGMPVPAVPPEIVRTTAAPVQKKSNIKVTFIELGSKDCLPCIMMSQVMDDIENEYEGQVLVRFYDVKTLLGEPYGYKYGIRIMPTQVFLDAEGREYYRHEGFFAKEDVVKVLQMKGVQ